MPLEMLRVGLLDIVMAQPMVASSDNVSAVVMVESWDHKRVARTDLLMET